MVGFLLSFSDVKWINQRRQCGLSKILFFLSPRKCSRLSWNQTLSSKIKHSSSVLVSTLLQFGKHSMMWNKTSTPLLLCRRGSGQLLKEAVRILLYWMPLALLLQTSDFILPFHFIMNWHRNLNICFFSFFSWSSSP